MRILDNKIVVIGTYKDTFLFQFHALTLHKLSERKRTFVRWMVEHRCNVDPRVDL